MAIVFSRPMRSDTQPKNGRVRPLVMRSMVSASGSAARPKTITLATPKSRAKAANCEMTIRPPVDIMVIMTNISQNTGVFSISAGMTSFADDASRRAAAALSSAVGMRIASAATAPTTPRMMPNTTSVCW